MLHSIGRASGAYSGQAQTIQGFEARVLWCESSEDGDGATGGVSSKRLEGRMPDSLRFAVQKSDGGLWIPLEGEVLHG